jgi:hypothetical protein
VQKYLYVIWGGGDMHRELACLPDVKTSGVWMKYNCPLNVLNGIWVAAPTMTRTEGPFPIVYVGVNHDSWSPIMNIMRICTIILKWYLWCHDMLSVAVISEHNHLKGTVKLQPLPRMYPEKKKTQTSRLPRILWYLRHSPVNSYSSPTCSCCSCL